MKVTLSIFGSMRDRLDRDAIEVEVGEGATVAGVLEALRKAVPETAAFFDASGTPRVQVARGEEIIGQDDPVKEGEALTIISPLAGG